MAMPVTTALFGRETETHVLGDLLDHVRDRGGSLVVSGEPGVGKSALLEEVSVRARGSGMLVLAATGVQSEAQLPFAGLHRLLQPVLGQVDVLPGPQRYALLAAFGMTDAAVPDLFLTALATLNLLAETANRTPVLVVADDAHWLDRSTGDVLAFIARRLEFEPILLIAAIRDGLESPFAGAGLPSVRLEALPPREAAALLDSRAPGLPAAVRERLLDEADGNPLALVELPAALEYTGSGAGLPAWLPLSTRLEQAFTARVSDLPATTRTALLVAALNDGPLLHEVLEAAALLAGRGLAVDVLTPAVVARLAEIDDGEFRFRHPLIRTAIYQAASVPQRHAAHGALADVLSGQPERRVWHQAASITGPDEKVAGELEAAAEHAQRRGATAAAVAALQRAAALSDDRTRIGRLLRAAQLAFEMGRHDLAVELLGKAEPLGLRPAEQARVVWIRESVGDGILGDAASARSLAALGDRTGADGDSDLAVKLLCVAALRCWWADPGQAARDRIVAAAERLDVDQSDPRLLVILSFAAPIGQGAAVTGRLSRLIPAAEASADAMRLTGMVAMAVGTFHVAAAQLAAAAARLRVQGRLALLARALVLLALSEMQLADLDAAIPAAEEGGRLAQETNQPLFTATARAVQAWLAALRGDQEAAASLAAQAERVSVPQGANAVLAMAQLARGLAALGSGLPADALQHLRRIHDRADPAYHDVLRCCTIGDLAEAARRSGDPGGIRVFMDEMETAARATPSPLLHAGLRYARALLADDADAGVLFETALESDMSTWPFLRARTQLAYGEWLHQQRRNTASRVPLRAARETFDALGVNPWSERARQLLRATGETSRPRTPEARDQLSPQELQIAQLAAEGLTNREIGQKLYLSPRTIGSHLYRAYPKLGITSRAQLREALGHKNPGHT
jgi:DNA-binding CsgD family transcriptional regulator